MSSSTTTSQRETDESQAKATRDKWVGSDSSRLRVVGRRRIPYLLLGAMLTLACAGVFAVITMTSGDRHPVLGLVRTVTVGHVLTAQDLREVEIAADPDVTVVRADQASTLIGQTMATSLTAGSLLTPDAVGPSRIPAQGQAITALALKPGQIPPELAAGAHVAIVSIPSTATGTLPADTNKVWSAVVASVTVLDNEQLTVVSALLGETDARTVAAVPVGQLSVAVLANGDR